jgi:hypothetical protein
VHAESVTRSPARDDHFPRKPLLHLIARSAGNKHALVVFAISAD